MFDINVVFPNFFVDLTYVWILTYNFWPVSVDKTIYEINYFMVPPPVQGR